MSYYTCDQKGTPHADYCPGSVEDRIAKARAEGGAEGLRMAAKEARLWQGLHAASGAVGVRSAEAFDAIASWCEETAKEVER